MPSTGKFTAPPPPPAPTPAQLALKALAAGCQIVSTGTPALNGTYDVSQRAQMRIAAIETGVLAGKGLPGGAATFPYPDASGAYHLFTADAFATFGAAIRDYVFGLEAVVGGASTVLPSQPVTIA